MTATKDVTLWCNGPGCVEWTTAGHSRVADTRRLAHLEGWHHIGDKDFCPRCAAEGWPRPAALRQEVS